MLNVTIFPAAIFEDFPEDRCTCHTTVHYRVNYVVRNYDGTILEKSFIECFQFYSDDEIKNMIRNKLVKFDDET